MANIKSAKKRILVSKNKTERNKAIRSKVRTYCKAVDNAVLKNDKDEALKALNIASVSLKKATSKGVYHKNTTSRKISRLTKAVNSI